MTNQNKNRVDYFPHYIHHKKTLFILEDRFGNDGYAFWFKLLELLGNSDGHFLELSKTTHRRFLSAKTKMKEARCFLILDLLAELEAIDVDLWGEKVIWSQNFIEGIADVYIKRNDVLPSKPSRLGMQIKSQSKLDQIDLYKCETKTRSEHNGIMSKKASRSKDDKQALPELKLLELREKDPQAVELTAFFIAVFQKTVGQYFMPPQNKKQFKQWQTESKKLLMIEDSRETIREVIAFAARELADYFKGIPYAHKIENIEELTMHFKELKSAQIRKEKVGQRGKASKS
ncbi:MAG: DUF4373 domain-containing protein [Deltaproteobacteria bacterium]|nr:DUF4373 domain-containing protein [Deltaproteobacteria bacterium]